MSGYVLSTNLHAGIVRSNTNWVKSAATCAFDNGNFCQSHFFTAAALCFSYAGRNTNCVTALGWRVFGSVGVRDSLTEKRLDSHIFRGPEIHYTLTRTTGTVMVSMLEI